MLELLKKPEAETDLLKIWRYTFETWGETRANHYLDGLELDMKQLTKTPYFGKSRDTLRTGYRSLHSGRHVIFYRVLDGAIEVIRILHDQMDPFLHIGSA